MDNELSHLAAEVHLNRRLKNLQRIDDTTEIDTDFIICAEYQLFLNDIGKNYQPAHWQTLHFPQGTAKKAVLGVRAPDVKEFCYWLSEKTGQNYRLPTPSEIHLFPTLSENKEYAVWCSEKGSYDLVWMAVKDKNNCLKHLQVLETLNVKFLFDIFKKIDKYQIFAYIFRYFYSGRGLDHRRSRKSNLDRYLDHVLGRGLELDLASRRTEALDRALDHDLDLNLARTHALDLANARALDLASARTLDLARAFNLARASVRARVSDLDSNRSIDDYYNPGNNASILRLAHTFDRDLDRYLDLSRVFDLARSEARSLAIDITLALDLNSVLIHESIRTLACDLNSADILGKALSNVLDFSKGNISFTNLSLEKSKAIYAQHFASLFRVLLAEISTLQPNEFHIRNAARKITLFELKTILTTHWAIFCDSLKPELTWFWKKRKQIDTQLLRDVLLAWFWALKIIDARIEGKIGAWEGIRIVRERKE